MVDLALSEADRQQMRSLGISEEQVRAQVEIFKRSSFFMRLNRPCTLGDGIQEIEPGDVKRYLEVHEQGAEAGRFLKFIPASGAATRMFKALFEHYQPSRPLTRGEISEKAASGDAAARTFLAFVDEIEQFAFFEDLARAMAENGLALGGMVQDDQFQDVLQYLLTERGINYGALPKGLLQFHRYPEGSRTPFEEHLVEALHYVRDRDGVCRLHFTVSRDHERQFRELLERVGPVYEKRFGVRYEVGFSQQKASTNTLAVDLNNRPFRDSEGRLLFRPGGHGALLENLNELQGDLVYIKNIDNVVPDHLKGETFFWKEVLGGYLAEIQETVHGYLPELLKEPSEGLLDEINTFCRGELGISPPESFRGRSREERADYLWRTLNRPIRVCGMVHNLGEPGGGPFWVEGRDGTLSLQIVESAQVDFSVPEQETIWKSATHFSPVDLVCAVRDHAGQPFDLKEFVDQEAVFISHKSEEGKELKALELPGLWNGSMAGWITLFVEVPLITFNPVKTVNDLLRPEHQPSSYPSSPDNS